MCTNTGRTWNLQEPIGRLYAQGSSPHVASYTDFASRAPERSLSSGKQRGIGQGGIRHQTNPGIGGGPRHEGLLLSFKILWEAAGR